MTTKITQEGFNGYAPVSAPVLGSYQRRRGDGKWTVKDGRELPPGIFVCRWDPKRFVAKISTRFGQKYLGVFETEEGAGLAIIRWKIKIGKGNSNGQA